METDLFQLFTTEEMASALEHCRSGGVALVVKSDVFRDDCNFYLLVDRVLCGEALAWVYDRNPERLIGHLFVWRNKIRHTEVSSDGFYSQAVWGNALFEALRRCRK